jgi:peroxiredoxin
MESEPGKKFATEQQKRIEAANKFDIKPEPDGKFVVFDVPPGRFGIRGRVDKEIGERKQKYVFEVFAQVDVGDKVDELLLDPIMVLPTPLFVPGDESPKFEVPSLDKSTTYKNSDFQGKHLFVHFWATTSQPSTGFQPEIQKMFDQVKTQREIELLSVSLDEEPALTSEFIQKQNFGGQHAFAGRWDHAIINDFGVRSIPSFWLIGPDGRILLTQRDFHAALVSGKTNLTQLVSDSIAGKDILKPAGK